MIRALSLILVIVLALTILASCDAEEDAWAGCSSCTSGDCSGESSDGVACENYIILGGVAWLAIFLGLVGYIRKQNRGFLASAASLSLAK